MLANKITTISLIILSVLLYVYIIPNQIEPPIFDGWTTPATLPNIIVIGIMLMALIQFFNTNSPPDFDKKVLVKSLSLAVLGIFFVGLMGHIGFLWVAPVLSVGIMVLIGERRPLWLILGGGIPIILWAGVVMGLGRTLP